jgi:hypothetical protein
MITNNGNGTYGVRFFVDGTAEYVTVNDELPVVKDGTAWNNGSLLKFANGAAGQPIWAELVEKAFAQLNAEPDAIHGEAGTATNAYSGISGGYAQNALTEITDQNSVTYYSNKLVANVATIGAAFQSGEEVELSVGTLPKGYTGDLHPEHVFEIIGYDASTEEFTVHNPWGSGAQSPTSQMTFTMSVQALAGAGCSMTVAEGTAFSTDAPTQVALAGIIGTSHGSAGHFFL